MNRTMGTGGRVLVVVLLAIGLTACGGAPADRGRDVAAQADALDNTIMAHETLIAQCMKDKGFEYVATLPRSAVLDRLSRLAQVEGRAFDEGTVPVTPDPNAAILAHLSDAGKVAWDDARNGNLDRGGTDPGCFDSTYAQAFGSGASRLDDPELVAQLDADFEADPRITVARRTYHDCMGSRGFAFTSAADMARGYADRQQRLTDQLRASGVADPDQAPAMLALVAEQTAASEANDACEPAYLAVEADVRLAILTAHGLR